MGEIAAARTDEAADRPDAAAAEPVIELRGVTFTYAGPPAVENVNLTIRRCEFVGLVGPNGGGKSTLLKLALGLIQPDRGTVRLLGVPPAEARKRVGYMPQSALLDPRFPVTVMDVVLMGRLGRSRALGMHGRTDVQIAAQALEEVGLLDCRRRSFAALSGGQRQRVLIARALACEPEMLLLDEPTANLDMRVEEQLYELLRRLNERLTIVLVSHDVGFVSQFVTRVVCVNRTVQVHTTSQVTGEVISELYGHDVRMVHHGHPHGHSHGHGHSHPPHSHGGR